MVTPDSPQSAPTHARIIAVPTVTTSYLVCATPRSGSSLLCDVLMGSHLAGSPEEYFWKLFEPEWSRRWRTSTYEDYLRAALSQTATPNGVFGAKIMWEQLDYFAGRLRRLPGGADRPTAQLLDAVFPHLHYIWIYRRDTVRQAVSLSRATQTGIWNDVGGERAPVPDPVFAFDTIDHLVQEIGEHNQNWRDFFDNNGIVPYTVAYERLEQDPEGVGREILRYLGISTAGSVVFAPRRLRKQADALSEEWVERYRARRAGRTAVVAE